MVAKWCKVVELVRGGSDVKLEKEGLSEFKRCTRNYSLLYTRQILTPADQTFKQSQSFCELFFKI